MSDPCITYRPSENMMPAQTALYLLELVERRTAYMVQRESTPKPPAYRKTLVLGYEREIERLNENIHNLTNSILDIARKYLPSVEIDESKIELAIADILAELPPPEELIVEKIFHSTQH